MDDVSEREDIQEEDLSMQRRSTANVRGGEAGVPRNAEEVPSRYVPSGGDYGYQQRDGSADYRPLRGATYQPQPQPYYLRER